MGLKGGQSWRRFRQESFENTNFSKTRQIPLGPREKLLGRAGLVLQIFFPESENYFKCNFLGVKVRDFSSEVGFRSRGQPEKPEIDVGVPRFGCSMAQCPKVREAASKKHAEAPLQRTGRQKGHKQAPHRGSARELRHHPVCHGQSYSAGMEWRRITP